MRKIMILAGAIVLAFSLAACSHGSSSKGNSSNSAGSSASSGSSYGANQAASDSGKFGPVKSSSKTGQAQQSSASQESAKTSSSTNVKPTPKRMVIYNAKMKITVSHFQTTQHNIQSLITQTGGFIVQSSFSKTETGKPTGTITARIPQQKFQSFMDKVGKMAGKVESRSVRGQDVTKHYVDLKSHLKAETAVKRRLESFLKKAKDAGDLLDISNQLANVQANIEQIKGEMKYLENHSALATVTINMTEADTGLKKQQDLNTSGKIHNAFINSLNALVSIASGLVVFFVGYSPIIILILIIAAIIYLVYRRRQRKGD